MKLKKWVPGMVLGTMMAAIMAMPVLADNINSGSTPPPRQNFRGLAVPVWRAVLEMTVGRCTILKIPRLPVQLLSQRIGMTIWQMKKEIHRVCPLAQKNPERVLWDMGF